MRKFLSLVVLASISMPSLLPAAEADEEVLNMRGMTVIGNQELPKSLMIVPWQPSELGELMEHSLDGLLDAGLEPVDREVFERKLDYYRVGAGQPLRPE